MTARRKIQISQPMLVGREREYVLQCLDTNWISSIGEFITRFETTFAVQAGTPYAVACCNGTAALHLALIAAGVGPGDEVLIPALTFVATAGAVRHCNAIPVLVDVEPDTWNLNPELIEAAVTTRTKAIVPVHLYGHPADMDPIREIASRYGLAVIEDAAEAHGARYRGRLAGSLGDLAAFSFFGNKLITCGEGGMVTTASKELADRVRLYRGQGMDATRRYWHTVIGYNYRMTNVAAAIGLGQAERLDWHLARRREVAGWYHRHLESYQDLFQLPVERDDVAHAYWMFSVVLRNADRDDRDRVIVRLAADGIETRPFFFSVQEMPPYADCRGTWEVSTDLAARGMNLPTHAALTEEDVAFVCDRLRAHASGLSRVGAHALVGRV